MWWWWWQAHLESSLTLATLLLGMGADVLQWLQDGRRDWRRCGQMGAGRVVAIAVGGVGQLDELAIGGVVGVRAAGIVTTHARFLASDAIGRLVLIGIAAILLQVALILASLGSGVEGVGLDTGNSQGGDGKDELWTDKDNGSWKSFPSGRTKKILNSRICSFFFVWWIGDWAGGWLVVTVNSQREWIWPNWPGMAFIAFWHANHFGPGTRSRRKNAYNLQHWTWTAPLTDTKKYPHTGT